MMKGGQSARARGRRNVLDKHNPPAAVTQLRIPLSGYRSWPTLPDGCD